MVRSLLILTLSCVLLSSCGFKRKKYDDPITKNTKQPDKVLFDKSINDIEHGRYEVARITLNTLINTYDQSEFLAKAKLAVADSWFREGGPHGLAEAEAEYKDFILFYPTMEEAAESQQKICMIHYKQMDKADRDQTQALRAEDECRQLLVQFPNSVYVAQTQQLLRNIQEALADSEFQVGTFYRAKGANPAAANRLARLVDQYPLYSKADLALLELGDAYSEMGSRFRRQAGEAYARIVKDYPLSGYADDAKKRLTKLEMPVPDADPAAVARMKYEQANRTKPGMVYRSTSFLHHGPDVSTAAKSGNPAMTNLRPTIPVSVPPPPEAAGAGVNDVTATVSTDTSSLNDKPDARMNPPKNPDGTDAAKPAAPATEASKLGGGTTAAANQPLPTNYKPVPQKKKKKSKKQIEQEQKLQQQQQQQAQPANGAPASTTPPAATPATPQAATPVKNQ
jgi:outer membrane protein assembly factor BamD